MKKILLVSLLIFPILCFAQYDLSPAKLRNLSIGFSFAPEFSYRTVKSDLLNDEVLNILSGNEKPKFGATAGFNAEYNFTNYLSLETGVLLSNKGYNKNFTSREGSQYSNKQNYSFNYYYLDIPLKIKYYFLGLSKIRFFASGGVIFNPYLFRKIYLNNKDITTQYIDYTIREIQTPSPPTPGTIHDNSISIILAPNENLQYNKLNFSGTISLGASYNIDERLALEAQLEYKHALAPLNNFDIEARLFSLGLNLSIHYKL
ncbi:PorT family protein [Paludibacter sp. 221]|uniref:porin family protein n=1 Tax=Paludibacter sp. 221 TaxID=2302939 RepID=UPI0013D21EF8|nr:porin family protein [Paludibacter sp. 221]NDV45950.1 PorT family protein [Paludibacter sp. 221]